MKRETIQRGNYNFRNIFSTVFFCALFVVGGLFFVALPASASHFSMTLSATTGIIDQGESVSFIATATCTSAPCENISFSVAGLPASASAYFSTSNCVPTCSTIVTIDSGSTSYGFYTFNIVGAGNHNVSSPFVLTIGYNIKGWAWSDGIGWISFNSENCDTNQNGVMDAGDTPPPAPAQCPSLGTVIPQYGAHLDLGTLVFSRFAWSENIGWIAFNKSDAGTPPAAPFNDSAQNYIARYNAQNGLIEGWARATSCPDVACDTNSQWGWIKMSGTATNGSPYGAHYTDAGGNRDFDRFAWGGPVMSWISFNSKNCDTDSNGVWDACGLSGSAYPYKVWVNGTLPNGVPTASNLKISFGDRCGAPLKPTFTFDYLDLVEGRPLVQYVIRVYEQGVVLPVDTILVPVQFDGFGVAKNLADSGFPASYAYTGSSLSYNKTYYFTVTVQDEAHLDVSLSSLPVFTSGFFKTDPHQRPRFVNSPEISWSPSAPFASSTVTLTASSTVYVGGADLTAQVSATSGNSIYLWTIATSTTSTFNSTLLSPQVVYPSSGNFDVTVKVADQSGNACYNSSSVSESCFCDAPGVFSVVVSKPKPVFREVKP